MKYLPLTKSAELTKNYRCGGWITLIIGLLIFSLVSSLVIQIGSFFSDSFGILIQLYFYSLVILAIILYSKFVEKRDIQSLGISSKNFTKNILSFFVDTIRPSCFNIFEIYFYLRNYEDELA